MFMYCGIFLLILSFCGNPSAVVCDVLSLMKGSIWLLLRLTNLLKHMYRPTTTLKSYIFGK